MKSINEWLQYIKENGLASTEPYCPLNYFISENKSKFCNEISNNLRVVQCEISFKPYCDYWKCSQSRRLWENYGDLLAAEFVGENSILSEEFLDTILIKHMKEKRILFVVFDFVDYGLDEDEDYNIYVGHTCCLIGIPNNNEYNFYYINSHGKDMLYYNYYYYRLSNKKKRTIIYDKPTDVMFLTSYMKYLKEKSELVIHYDESEKHNYYGADYQSGDHHGICFIYPYIIWYYFCKYYDCSRNLEGYTIKSNKEMFLEGNMIECVEGYLCELNSNYKKMYLKLLKSEKYNRKYYVAKLDKVIERSSNYFTHKILNKFMPYFTNKNS